MTPPAHPEPDASTMDRKSRFPGGAEAEGRDVPGKNQGQQDGQKVGTFLF